LAQLLAREGTRTLVVDCDPNPTLAETLGLDSRDLVRFSADRLRRAGRTLELAHEPSLVPVGEHLWLLGGPPGEAPLADAVARGIAGVLLADRFDAVVTDLGAGPELARTAVGGLLNPADLCLVLVDGSRRADLAAERIADSCRGRGVPFEVIANRRGDAEGVAAELAARFRGDLGRARAEVPPA
jgi:CO dehydrogenase nickel-insertion accessory protein CooC1